MPRSRLVDNSSIVIVERKHGPKASHLITPRLANLCKGEQGKLFPLRSRRVASETRRRHALDLYLIRAIVTDALKIMINTLKIVMAEIERRGLRGSCWIACCAGLRSLYQSLSYMLMKNP